MRRPANLLLALGLGACFTPRSGLTDEMPETFPAGSCEDTDTDACATSSATTGAASSTGAGSSSTAATALGCEGTEACLGDDSCVADWDARAESRGPFACRFICVPLLDEAAWCSDDASCCDASARCMERGYCVLPESGDDGSVSSSGGSTG